MYTLYTLYTLYKLYTLNTLYTLLTEYSVLTPPIENCTYLETALLGAELGFVCFLAMATGEGYLQVQ